MGSTVWEQKRPHLHNVRKRLNPEQMRRQIKEGGKSMPAFTDALNDQQIDELITFLRPKSAWKKPLPPPATNK